MTILHSQMNQNVTTPSESRRRLPEAARDIYGILVQFRGTIGEELARFKLLERVFKEQCKVTIEAGDLIELKEPAEIPCDNVLNPADPDAGYNKNKGVGYLVQGMETYTEKAENDSALLDSPDVDSAYEGPDLITHVAVGKMNVHDRSALEPALDDVEHRNIAPKALLADTHYGPTALAEKAGNRGVELIAPAMTPNLHYSRVTIFVVL